MGPALLLSVSAALAVTVYTSVSVYMSKSNITMTVPGETSDPLS